MAVAGEILGIARPTEAPLGGICARDRGRMHRRLLGARGRCSHFHVMSRTAGGERLFGDEEKEAFRVLMGRMARFSGVEVLTYCVMGNHFHLLVRVPDRERFIGRFASDAPGDAGERRLLEHLELLYSEAYLSRLGCEIVELRARGREAEVRRVLDRYKARCCDLSLFVKELKERFSRWFNKRHSRRGTLWMERFRSVIIEDGACLRAVAAYIDLNPVRAGLVSQPEDYRWCGYAEALGGSRELRRGLCRAIGWPADQWQARGQREQGGAVAYRCLLYERGASWSGDGDAARRGVDVEQARAVIAGGGALSDLQLACCRVRWFSEGVALGGERFLRQVLGEVDGRVGQVRALPVEEAGGSAGWFSLSHLRRQGIG